MASRFLQRALSIPGLSGTAPGGHSVVGVDATANQLKYNDGNGVTWTVAASGAGGTVTQITTKATGVTLSKLSGQITTTADALAGGAEVSFIVTNTLVGAKDVPVVAIASGGTASAYAAVVQAVAASSFTITLSNLTAGSLSEALVINFVIIPGA